MAIPVLAVWSEPSVPSAGGNPAETIRPSGNQTKLGSLELTGGATAQGANATSGGSVTSGITGYGTGFAGTCSNATTQRCTLSSECASGGTCNVATVSAGIFGRASAINPIGFQAGILGVAGSNSATSIGVYGDAAGNSNAWAGFFSGKTNVTGPVNVTGSSSQLITNSVSLSNSLFSAVGTASNGYCSQDPSQSCTSDANCTGGICKPRAAIAAAIQNYGGNASAVFSTVKKTHSCAGCVAVLGATSDFDPAALAVGIWSGYYMGPVRVTDRIYHNNRLTSPSFSLSDPALYKVPSLSGLTPGTLLGVTTSTGAATDATGGITSTGQHLIVTDYTGVDTKIARLNPLTLQPESASDIVDLANPAQQVTYDGKDVWVRSADTLRQLSGQTFAEIGFWTFGTHTLDNAQPTFWGTTALANHTVAIGVRDPGNNDHKVGYAPNVGGGATVPTLQQGCTAPQRGVVASDGSGGTALWIAAAFTCGSYNTNVVKVLPNGTATEVTVAGTSAVARGIAYDGSYLWISGEDAFNVRLIKINPAFPTLGGLGSVTLPGTAGYTAGPVVFDGTALWVSASNFTAGSYDGKLFRIPLATLTATLIDRTSSAAGASPIQDLYFDGNDLFLYGYNPGAAPRINYYVEKRSR